MREMNTAGQSGNAQVDVLFLTGQPGSGKTAVAKEIGEMLWRIREPHALIDVDELCRGVLPTKTVDFNRSLAIANLKAVWANFYAAGVRRLILARMIESAEDLEQYRAAFPNARIMFCLMQVPPELIQERLTIREQGSARDFLLNITNQIAERIAMLDLPGIVVQNGQRPLKEVALEVLERATWPTLPIE